MDPSTQLFLMGYRNNIDSSSSSSGGTSQNLYGNMFSHSNNENPVKDFIEDLMKSQQVRFLTCGMSTILEATRPLKMEIGSASIMNFMQIGSLLGGFRIPTPGAALGLRRKGGRGR